MEHEEYQNTIRAVEALTRLIETLVYQEKQQNTSFIDLRIVLKSNSKNL